MNRRTMSAIRSFAVAALLALAWGLSLLPAAQAQATGAQPDRQGPGQERSGPAGRHRHRHPEGDRPHPQHRHRERRHLPAAVPAGRHLHRRGGAQRLRHGHRRERAAQRRHPARDQHRHEPVDGRRSRSPSPPRRRWSQTTPAVGTVVSQQQLENLPLNGRQFANLAVARAGHRARLQLRPDQAGPAHRRAQRRHRPQRQLPGRRRRQHRRHDRRRAAELQPGERPGVQHPDPAVQGRVRPLDRRRADRRHQDRHQRDLRAAPGASSARTA